MSAPTYPGVLLRVTTPWMSGEAVVALQQRLGALGLAGEVGPTDLPGTFGVGTSALVRDFQRRAGLGVDGLVGPRTWAALFTATPAPAAVRPAGTPAPPQSPNPAPAASHAPASHAPASHTAASHTAASGDPDFDRALKFVLKWEGGFVDDPADPGGRTNKGVTFRVYDAWRQGEGLPTRDVKLITDDEVAAIYRRDYWRKSKADTLAWPVDLLHFDTAVNMGVGRAVRFLQEAARVEVDGGFDDGTAAAVAAADRGELALRYAEARDGFYRRLAAQRPTLAKFLRGWLNRLNALRREAGLPAREAAPGEDPEFTPRIPEDVDSPEADAAPSPEVLEALAELARLAASPDQGALQAALDRLRAALAASPGAAAPGEAAARSCLLALRGARRFAAMKEVAALAVAAGRDTPAIRRDYAQALIDTGELLPAMDMLERAFAARPDDPGHRAEAAGLLGRAWKQAHVLGGGAHALQQAIRWYEAAMRAGGAGGLPAWPAINVVALAARARRGGLDPLSPVDPMALATGILAQPADGGSPWGIATRAEAAIALGNQAEAERLLRDYLRHPATDAFMVGGTLRQLTEIWGLGTAPGQAGADIVAALRADLLRREGGALSLTPDEVGELAATPRATLERVLGEPGIVTWEWMRTGLARAAAVGVIRRADGRGVGTGFLVQGAELDPRLGEGLVLVTNAHVLSHDAADRPAAEATASDVLFEAAPGRPAFRIRELLWSSPVEALDACVARLDGRPDIAPIPLFDGELPEPNGGEGPVEAEQRLYIIGHPLGGALSFSIQDNLLLDHEGPPGGKPSAVGRILLHYRTPTEPGSSGSPVFDPVGWRAVALHHAGGLVMRRLNGRPGTYAANEGIALASIRAALSRALPPAE